MDNMEGLVTTIIVVSTLVVWTCVYLVSQFKKPKQ